MITISPAWAAALLLGVLLLGLSMGLFLIRRQSKPSGAFAVPIFVAALVLLGIGVTGCVSAIVAGS